MVSLAWQRLVGLIKHVPPVRPQRLDAELGDRHPDHRRQGDEPRRKVGLAQIDRGGPATDVEVRMGDRAAAYGVPVVGKDDIVVSGQETVGVAGGRHSPRGATDGFYEAITMPYRQCEARTPSKARPASTQTHRERFRCRVVSLPGKDRRCHARERLLMEIKESGNSLGGRPSFE